jgi:hypothetical protein
MNQIQQAAQVEYEFTMRREDVINDEFDYAMHVLDSGQILNTQQAQTAWLEYANRVDAELFSGLRIGTDYDFDLLVKLTAKKCNAQGVVGGVFCTLDIETFGSFYDCKTELIAAFVAKFGDKPEFILAVPK